MTAPQHTPEPWTLSKDKYDRIEILAPMHKEGFTTRIYRRDTDGLTETDAARIVAAVNGCAGLNPAAYRECVEALKIAREVLPEPGVTKEVWTLVNEAIAHAEG